MELYQLKTFVAVAEEEHLTRAAERLNTSQPSVSAHIKALEEELGVKLFKRLPKGMQLTEAGKILKEKAVQTLDLEKEMLIQAKQLKKELSGVVTLGLNIDPRYLRIEELFATIKEQFPGLELHLLHKPSWEVLNKLKLEKLDIGFIYGEHSSAEIVAEVISQYNLLIAGPVSWQSKLENGSIEELCELPWIWTPSQCFFNGVAEKLFSDLGKKPNKAAVSDQESTLKMLASSEVGITLMIEKEAIYEEKQGTVFARKQPVSKINLSFAYHQKNQNDPLIQAVSNCIREVWLTDRTANHS